MHFKIWTITDTITNFIIGVKFGYYNAWRRILERMPDIDKVVIGCFDAVEEDNEYFIKIEGMERSAIYKQFVFWYLPNHKPYEHNFKYKHDFQPSTRS